MPTHIYLYRMTNDSGNAPCVFENNYKPTKDLLTLACCKGGQIIRKTDTDRSAGLRFTIGKNHTSSINGHTIMNNDTVYVVGIYKNYLLYIAELTDILTMSEYFSCEKYMSRTDSIYTVEADGSFTRNGRNPLFHPHGGAEENRQHRKDRSGKYVLLSKKFCYFGNKYSDHPIDFHVLQFLPKRQETKHYDESEQEAIKALLPFIESELGKQSNFHPIEDLKPLTKGCCQK